MAAKHISKTDLLEFKEAMDQEIQSYKDRSIESFIDANNKMHRIIANASRNKYYIRYIDELIMRSNIYIIFHDDFHSKPFDDLYSIKEHNELYDALFDNNPEAASIAMEKHVRSIYENLGVLRIQI